MICRVNGGVDGYCPDMMIADGVYLSGGVLLLIILAVLIYILVRRRV